MNENTILDAIFEINDKFSLGWDTDSKLITLARFIAANANLAEFQSFLEQEAKDELEIAYP